MPYKIPNECTRPVVLLHERTVAIEPQNKKVLGLTRDGDSVALSRLHLNLPALANPVMAFGRCLRELNAVVIGGKSLTQTAHHMPIRREVPSWKH